MEIELELKRSDLSGLFTNPQVTQGSGRAKWPGRRALLNSDTKLGGLIYSPTFSFQTVTEIQCHLAW